MEAENSDSNVGGSNSGDLVTNVVGSVVNSDMAAPVVPETRTIPQGCPIHKLARCLTQDAFCGLKTQKDCMRGPVQSGDTSTPLLSSRNPKRKNRLPYLG